MTDLSILIPARNEIFLKRTIEDILEHIEGNTEIIAVLDGYWPDPGIPDNPRVTIIHHTESIGQRAATNEAARLSQAEYLMKVDAHCAFDQGFDIKLMNDMQDDWTVAPTMRNLHAFDWICENGHRRYQGPSGSCQECGQPTIMDVVWIAKKSPQSNSYCFDSEPHFQYFGEYNKRKEGQGQITESMSLQGSCFMLTRNKYFELNMNDESFGSWGSQGIEIAVKTWLSGGKVMINHNTFYAHMFRTQGGDFGFPYPQSGKQIENAKSMAKKVLYENWPNKVYSLSWLLEKFWPVKGWTQDQLDNMKKIENMTVENAIEVTSEIIHNIEEKRMATKGIIYYTDNRLDSKIMKTCQDNLSKIAIDKDLPIISTSLKSIDFGTNLVMNLERGPLTMFKQILRALESSSADIIYFCEHDVLYHSSHFDFIPPDKNTFYYNMNSLLVRLSDMYKLYYDHRSLSGLCVYREAAIKHYRERIERVEKEGYSTRMGFEPFTHHRINWENKYEMGDWKSQYPNLDLKHDNNLTPARWSQDKFRDKRNCQNWKEFSSEEEIPGWTKEQLSIL